MVELSSISGGNRLRFEAHTHPIHCVLFMSRRITP